MTTINDSSRGRSTSPRPRWSAADSDRCECVLEVRSDDVLLGRGSGPNDHVGNIKFRDLVHDRKPEYLSTNHRQTKATIAKNIVDQVYQRGGRFLKKLNPVESAKKLPELQAANGGHGGHDIDANGPCDVYQIQKHATVMEKAKQALRQNQRNGSLDPPENRSASPLNGSDPSHARGDSMGRNNNLSPETPSHGILLNNNNNNNWSGMGMANMNIPTTLNNNSQGNHNSQRHHGGQYHINNDHPNNAYSSNSPQGRNQDSSYQQQMVQQQQDLMNLQQQHDLLQMQYQQRQQQKINQQQYQSQHLEMETHNQLLQEQLELQLRQEQLRQLQQQSLQKLARSQAMYSKQHQHDSPSPRDQYRQPEPTASPSQSVPPAVLNGYATYTTTLDAIEDNHQNSADGLAHPQVDGASIGNETDPGKLLGDKFDDKSMQMSTMMGSFKDMSVKSGSEREDHAMMGSTASIGTIENIPQISVGGLSMAHMSGISIMSMMNDSNDSLFNNNLKAGNAIGENNASWGNNSGGTPLADVVESTNPAAVAAAAVLEIKQIPGFEKAQRRWSGGFMPPTEVPVQRRVNRRGSLQYTSANPDPVNEMNQMNTMATATAMLAMAKHNQQMMEQQGQNVSNFNPSNGYANANAMAYGQGGHEMMNHGNQQYLMENGAPSWRNGAGDGMNTAGSNMSYHNN